jgi:membrane protease YdiL (CAAX protease family)
MYTNRGKFDKNLSVFLIGFLFFNLLPSILYSIGFFEWLDANLLYNIRYYSYSDLLTITAYMISITMLFALIGRTYFDKLIDGLKKHNNIIRGIAIGVIIVTVTVLYNLLINTLVSTGSNINEQSVESLTIRRPFEAFLIIVIIAPIFEEYIYRFGLFGFFKKKSRFLAYVFTILIFALIHFNISVEPSEMINELLNLPSYLIAAGILSYAYDKYDISVSIYAHMFNNLIAFISTFIPA